MKVEHLPFGAQAIIMFCDELFHHRRRLPRWEAYGHPFDTLTVFLCYAFLSQFPFSPIHLDFYLVLCTFSCLVITKDEWIHKELCSGIEHWFHSLLFILHPIVLGVAAWQWAQPQIYNDFNEVVRVQLTATSLFMAYQFLYWRTRWKPHSVADHPSTTRFTTN